MGLDTSHGAYNGSYGNFNRFRFDLLAAIGGKWPDSDSNDFINFGPITKRSHPGLYVFFCHSDCDGTMSPGECRACADEMENLLRQPDFHAGEFLAGCMRDWIHGCRRAANANENLEFH
jgi:hypothetical protein